jgi:hypothetical protein
MKPRRTQSSRSALALWRVAIVALAAMGCSRTQRALTRADAAAPDASKPGTSALDAAAHSPCPSTLPERATPCVPLKANEPGSNDLCYGGSDQCWNCGCRANYETHEYEPHWQCRVDECPGACPDDAPALEVTNGTPQQKCATPYPTTCRFSSARCRESCLCPGVWMWPPSDAGASAPHWDCVAECTGCPTQAPHDGERCWGEPEPCVFPADASSDPSAVDSVVCHCVVRQGEDLGYTGGDWHCHAANGGDAGM